MRPLSEVLESVYALPNELHARMALGRQVSLLGLLQDTGYPAMKDKIDVAALQAGLRERHGIVDCWLRYSADKDVSWGWFFEKDRRGRYVVGLKSGFSERARADIADPWLACAYFIEQELEAILGSSRAAPR